jgi:stage V sporulation protein B
MSDAVIAGKSAGQATASTAIVAGRGTIYITLAKAWFMITGYGIYFSLPRLISAEQFGLYQVVIGVVSIVNAVLITGTSQTVSKFVSQEPAKSGAIKTAALRTQVIVGTAVSLGFFLLAPVMADRLNDSRLSSYFRLAAAIPLFYSFYAVFTGYFNGRKQFLKQASIDMTYSTLKAAFIVSLAWLGYGVWGGVGGFVLAAGAILLIASIAARDGASGERFQVRGLFAFQFYLLASTLIMNLLQKADLILVKAVSASDPAVAAANAGYYGAAVNVANITFQVIVSITFVIFPLVSEATFNRDVETTQVYVVNTLRAVLIIMVVVATLFSANARSVLVLLYPRDYQEASHALAILAFGALLFGLFYVTTTIITASGKPLISLAFGSGALVANAAFNLFLIPRFGLSGAAAGVVASMLLGVLGSLAYLSWHYGRILPVPSLIRLGICAGVVYGVSLSFTPGSKLLTLVKLVALGALFLTLLLITREVKKSDLAAIRGIVKV